MKQEPSTRKLGDNSRVLVVGVPIGQPPLDPALAAETEMWKAGLTAGTPVETPATKPDFPSLTEAVG